MVQSVGGETRDKVKGTAREQATLHAEWASFITRNFCRFSFRTRKEPDFRVDASVRSANGFMLARFKTIAGNAQLDRGTAEIRKDGEDAYALYMPMHGEYDIAQLNRSERCVPGSLIFVSMAEPLLHTKLGDNDTQYFFLPREFVDQRLLRAESVCAYSVAAEAGMPRLLRESLSAFQASAAGMSDEQFHSAARIVGDLAVLALSGHTDAMADLRSVRAANLARVKRVLRARLADSDLTLAGVAAECRLSLRYLHALFREDGYTAAEYLKRERLQCARRMLEVADPSRTSVTQIALACGFSSASRFSTEFRRGFSLSPKDVLRRR